MAERTRWDFVRRDIIRAALELNGGKKGKAAKFLGVSVRTMTNYFTKYPELTDYLCAASKNASVKIRNRVLKEKKKDNKNECHELRPIGWVPQWYKDKYPSLFKD